jgi:cytochrome c553
LWRKHPTRKGDSVANTKTSPLKFSGKGKREMLSKVLVLRVAASVCVTTVGILLSSTSFAADEGEKVAFKHHCVTCHGYEGKSNASRYPNLAGQNAPYLASRLKYFRSEEEPGNQMNAQAVLLTDGEIDLLADYFSKQSN